MALIRPIGTLQHVPEQHFDILAGDSVQPGCAARAINLLTYARPAAGLFLFVFAAFSP